MGNAMTVVMPINTQYFSTKCSVRGLSKTVVPKPVARQNDMERQKQNEMTVNDVRCVSGNILSR